MYRLLGHRLSLLALITAVVLISGCSATATSSALGGSGTSVMPTVTTTPLAEHLIFKGDVSGTLTTGVNPRPLNHDNPTTGSPPQSTQCSTFASLPGSDTIDDYVAVIVGNVGSQRYAVTIEVNEDNPAYTKPGTQLLPGDTNDGGSVEIYEVGGHNRRWQQVFGPNSQDPAVIVLHADRKSGTVDAWMASTELSQKDAPATLHLQGDWRCG